ncbi:MAG: SEL1-like repeat protein [Planctomycetes bacterium]|nr:SEL1-like repeat protein [Planctomycetota bacterium]MBL7038783.1 SEL1-like repeat protein [Pirellulaceae bacterium]
MRPLLLLVLASLIAILILSSHSAAAEISGTVDHVDDKVVRITSTADILPKVGDRFDVFVEIPGAGKAEVGQGKITSVDGGTIVGAIETATGRVQPGQQITIHSPEPTPRPPTKVPVLIGRSAADAKKAIADAGFQAELKVGVAAPAGVQPYSVYAQDPAVGSELAKGGKVVVTLFADDGSGTASMPPQAKSDIPPVNISRSSDPRDNRFPPLPELEPDQPWLGVSHWCHDDRTVVCGVLKDGPAAKAGLKAEDVILSTNEEKIGSRWNSLRERLNTHKAGETIAVAIERAGDRSVVQVTLEAIPADGGNGRFLAAAEEGESWAMAEIGVRYAGWRDDGTYLAKEQQDAQKAIDWFRRSSEAGCAAGAYYLAGRYRYAQTVEEDPVKAAELYERARTLDGPGARNVVYEDASENLAKMYLDGEGVSRDESRAAALYREVAERGGGSAGFNLAELYKNGRGVPKDNKLAMHWYYTAAKIGNRFAQTEMGRIAYEGRGVQRNYATALTWYKLAAENGSAWAMINLGQMYENGQGVARDIKQAVAWYQKASKAAYSYTTDAAAKYALGRLYEQHGRELGYGDAEASKMAMQLYQGAAKYSTSASDAFQRIHREIYVQLPPPTKPKPEPSELPRLSGTYDVQGAYRKVATKFIWRQLDANTASVTFVLDGQEPQIMRRIQGNIPQSAIVTAKRQGNKYVVPSTATLASVLTTAVTFTPAGKQLHYDIQQSNGINVAGIATRK